MYGTVGKGRAKKKNKREARTKIREVITIQHEVQHASGWNRGGAVGRIGVLMLTRRGVLARIRVTSVAKHKAVVEGEEEAMGHWQQAEHEDERRMTNCDEFGAQRRASPYNVGQVSMLHAETAARHRTARLRRQG
jgi:hypothetical protein